MAHTAYSFTQQIKGVDGLRLYKMIIRRALRTLSLAPSSVPILTITSSSASPAVAAGDRGKTSPTVHMAPCWKTGNINFLARLSETVNCSRWPVIVICRIKERTPKPPPTKRKNQASIRRRQCNVFNVRLDFSNSGDKHEQMQQAAIMNNYCVSVYVRSSCATLLAPNAGL